MLSREEKLSGNCLPTCSTTVSYTHLSADTCHRVEPDSLIEAAGQLQQTLTEKAGGKLIKGILAQMCIRDRMKIEEGSENILVGAIDEMTETSYTIQQRLGMLKGIAAGDCLLYTSRCV